MTEKMLKVMFTTNTTTRERKLFIRRDFNIFTWSYFSVEDYIKYKSEFSTTVSFYHIKLIVSLHLSQVK